jgi:GTP cyclohydrolase II
MEDAMPATSLTPASVLARLYVIFDVEEAVREA